MSTRVLRSGIGDLHRSKGPAADAEATLEISSRFGVDKAASKLVTGEPLFQEEALTLPGAPLFLLAALVGIKNRWQNYGKLPHVRPVHLLPFAEWSEELGFQVAKKRAAETLRTVDAQLGLNSALFVALDRWSGKFRFGDYLSHVSRIVEQHSGHHKLILVGPSTAELNTLLTAEQQQRSVNRDEWYSTIFSEMRSHGVISLDGGTDIELHAFAAMRGMKVSVGHDISPYIEAAVYAPISENYQEENFYRVLEERFILELLDIRNRISATGNLRTWFPWFRSALQRFHKTSDQAFGAPLLRVIAFARLLLPEAQFVRAPVGLFGKNLAHVAVLFGSNDLGFVAVDAVSAKMLGVPKLSEISRLFQEEGLFPTLTT